MEAAGQGKAGYGSMLIQMSGGRWMEGGEGRRPPRASAAERRCLIRSLARGRHFPQANPAPQPTLERESANLVQPIIWPETFFCCNLVGNLAKSKDNMLYSMIYQIL